MYEFENRDYFEPGYDKYDETKKEDAYFATGHQEEKKHFGTNPAQGESHV